MIKKIKDILLKIKHFIRYQIFYFRFYRDKRVKALNYLLDKKVNIANSYCIFNEYGFPMKDVDDFINYFREDLLEDDFSYSFYRECMENRQRKVRVYEWFKLNREIDDLTLFQSEKNFEAFLNRVGICYEKVCLYKLESGSPHSLENVVNFTSDIVVDIAEYNKRKIKEKRLFTIREYLRYFTL